MADYLVIPASLLHSGERVTAATWQDAVLAHCQATRSDGHFAAIRLADIRRARSTVTRGEPQVQVQPDP